MLDVVRVNESRGELQQYEAVLCQSRGLEPSGWHVVHENGHGADAENPDAAAASSPTLIST
jgi:hypothetical protein